MIHYVPLSQLPEDLEFPQDLQHRVWYDRSKQRLAFDGFMSKEVFDRLEALHDDFAYSRATEQLFRVAVPESTQTRSHASAPIWLITGLLATLALTLSVWWWAG